jgi:hypothetical protein
MSGARDTFVQAGWSSHPAAPTSLKSGEYRVIPLLETLTNEAELRLLATPI